MKSLRILLWCAAGFTLFLFAGPSVAKSFHLLSESPPQDELVFWMFGLAAFGGLSFALAAAYRLDLVVLAASLGVLVGSLLGSAIAQHSPLWGVGQPKDSLVPGHALLFSTIFGTIAFIAATRITRAIHAPVRDSD